MRWSSWRGRWRLTCRSSKTLFSSGGNTLTTRRRTPSPSSGRTKENWCGWFKSRRLARTWRRLSLRKSRLSLRESRPRGIMRWICGASCIMISRLSGRRWQMRGTSGRLPGGISVPMCTPSLRRSGRRSKLTSRPSRPRGISYASGRSTSRLVTTTRRRDFSPRRLRGTR